jgi:two-component system, NtrC family, sensor kinase
LLSKWPIRNKLLIGIGLLLVIVATLSGSGFLGVYAYRSLVRSLSGRANELPRAAELSEQVSDLRVIIGEIRSARGTGNQEDRPAEFDLETLSARFEDHVYAIRSKLVSYREQLLVNDRDDTAITDSRDEWDTVRKIDDSLQRITDTASDDGWISDGNRLETIHVELEHLQDLSWKLPSFLHRRIIEFAGEVKTQYRALIIVTWITTVSATLLLGLFIRLFYTWVFLPLRVLVQGSRRVAGGEFGYRIALDTHDEMSELADALNDMTARFETIRDGLDRQVQERTKQVVRSEQLASVGFLAAGVAHEINNPLASIALCAESLESRIQEILSTAGDGSAADQKVIRDYLRMIQNEAFRCKGITERLLDFSRMGDVTRQSTDLRELIQGVIDMVAHLGRYQDKQIDFLPGDGVIAPVNPQELKQVVLNLITNGLDSLSPGGRLSIALCKNRDTAEIMFSDNGCGMTDEVLEHLFEPFFTRRRHGQGTGLGLSITYRIVADHDGHIDVHSEGPGKGSQFRVALPLAEKHKESHHRYQAA